MAIRLSREIELYPHVKKHPTLEAYMIRTWGSRGLIGGPTSLILLDKSLKQYLRVMF
jgi:hypothetical protein